MNRLTVALAVLLAVPAAMAEGPLVAPRVRIVPARPVTASTRESVTGQLGPSRLLPLGFEVGGRLVTSRVSKGDLVKAGQSLGNLDTEIINAQVAQAEAGLMAAEAGAALALDVAGRNEKLKAEGSVSDLQFKQTDAQAKGAKAQVAQARAGVAQANAGLRRHFLSAPFAATVVDAPDNTGGMVGPGTPVYILMQLDPLVLKVTIPEKVRESIKAGLKVRVEATGSGAATDDAVVKVVLPSADPQTRRVPLEITVPNADGRFVANTLARVTINLGEPKPAVVIPSTALGTTGGEHVFAVDESGALKRVPVKVMERGNTTVTVTTQTPVTQVVDYPTSALVEGTKVTQR
ncbi:MAG: efflux RND transporter periplasmic adaptor subunit [Archangium sp.]|nr:efflux RND transporter periplasmic adaptor subunit [Archangium sp.]